ncbi:hypothetical protein ACFQ80_21700 [Isoptericola sp. NPDC056578]|uniref:hypothetical protein n=1 Tax=Isoptericola sp. NPDC056578 TaxID=3345870 RepID=UPI003673A205
MTTLVVGVVLLLVGIRIELPRAGSGWFAYAPLSGTVFVPGNGLYWFGPALVGAGALLVGLGGGFLLGRRRD